MNKDTNISQITSLRIIAARFLSSDAKQGLVILDEIIWGIFKANFTAVYFIVAFYVLILTLGFALLTISIFTLGEPNWKKYFTSSLLYIFVGMGLAIFLWRAQEKPAFRPEAMHMNDLFSAGQTWDEWVESGKFMGENAEFIDDDETSKSYDLLEIYGQRLEQFFDVLRDETKTKAFYISKRGVKQFIDHQCYNGKFRILLLSKQWWVRFLVVNAPFIHATQEPFIDLTYEEFTEKSKIVKSKNSGRKEKYDYKKILLMLIERPELKNITGAYGDITAIIKLIYKLKDKQAENNEEEINLPERAQLEIFAKEIKNSIVENKKN